MIRQRDEGESINDVLLSSRLPNEWFLCRMLVPVRLRRLLALQRDLIRLLVVRSHLQVFNFTDAPRTPVGSGHWTIPGIRQVTN